MIIKLKYLGFIFLLISRISYSQIPKEKIYLIPGQGSDYRIYKHFRFNNFDTIHIHYIISSAKNRNELPLRYRFMKKIPINKLFGGMFLRAVTPLVQLIVEPDSKNERETCKAMLKNKNKIFMKRSVNMIVNWKRRSSRTKIFHIHGNKDHTIPIRNIKNINIIVKNGSHMMTITRGQEITSIIRKYLHD